MVIYKKINDREKKGGGKDVKSLKNLGEGCWEKRDHRTARKPRWGERG